MNQNRYIFRILLALVLFFSIESSVNAIDSDRQSKNVCGQVGYQWWQFNLASIWQKAERLAQTLPKNYASGQSDNRVLLADISEKIRIQKMLGGAVKFLGEAASITKDHNSFKFKFRKKIKRRNRRIEITIIADYNGNTTFSLSTISFPISNIFDNKNLSPESPAYALFKTDNPFTPKLKIAADETHTSSLTVPFNQTWEVLIAIEEIFTTHNLDYDY